MTKHATAIIVSGCLWGLMGLFRRYMGDIGLSAPGIILLRCGMSALLFAATLLLTDRRQFVLRLRDLWCFIGAGVVSLLFFSYCYYQAISLMSLSAAAILLYTAPSIVMLLSLFCFGEKLTVSKVAALLLAFLGCALVSGLGTGSLSFTLSGLLFGLGAGAGYALYSIFARLALNRGYSSNTVNFYSCLLAALGAAAIWGVRQPVSVMFASWDNALLCVLASVLTSYLPYLFYTYGLTGMETGRASVMASVEPVVATLLGVAVFHEALTPLTAVGVALVLSAVVMLNIKLKKA